MAKKSGKLARRYARALLGAVEEELGSQGKPTPAQNVAQAFSEFAELWASDKQLSLYVLSPKYEEQERLAALLAVGRAAELPDILQRFLRVLTQHDRIGVIEEIAAAFRELADKAVGIVAVEIITARAVEVDETGEVEQVLRKQIEGEPIFSWAVDPKLLGGMTIRYAGKVVDGSLSSQLKDYVRVLTR